MYLKPWRICRGTRLWKSALWMREIGSLVRLLRDKFVPLQTKQRYSTRDISGKVFLTLFFRGFVPFLSRLGFVSRNKFLQNTGLQGIEGEGKGKNALTTNNHQKIMTEISMRSFIDGRSVEQSHRFVLRAIFWQIFLLSRSSTFPEFLLTLTVLASHRRELRPFQTRLPKVCFWIFQVDIEDTDGFIIVSDMSTIQSFSYIFLATGRASFGSKNDWFNPAENEYIKIVNSSKIFFIYYLNLKFSLDAWSNSSEVKTPT